MPLAKRMLGVAVDTAAGMRSCLGPRLLAYIAHCLSEQYPGTAVPAAPAPLPTTCDLAADVACAALLAIGAAYPTQSPAAGLPTLLPSITHLACTAAQVSAVQAWLAAPEA